jgi:transcriptional regulator with XRE-family HTH domain
MENEDLIWKAELLGSWLRFIRLDRGYSQVQLAELSAVVPSEIHRIEVGQRECRIETLVKLCGPLGITPGWILDRVTSSNIALFSQKIHSDSDFKALTMRLKVKGNVNGALACACVLASILIRSSSPVERVGIEEFPHKGWKKPFTEFARRLEKMGGDSTERAAILHNLLEHPVRELSNQDLIVDTIFKGLEQTNGNYSWPVMDLRFPRPVKWS